MAETGYDQALADAVQDLVQRGELDIGSPAYGVALKAIHVGLASLTRMERKLYDQKVVPALDRHASAAGTTGSHEPGTG